jgi:RNase P/RNase MRP subunit p30
LDVPDGNLLQQFKKKVDLIAVKGGNPTMNGFAVKAKGVDFLLMPCSPNRAEFDRQTARNAADNGVPIAITFSDFLSANPFQRSQLLKNYSMVVKLCKKTGASCLFFTGARNATELRAPKDFAAFAQLLGFNAEQANKMVFEVPEKIFQE